MCDKLELLLAESLRVAHASGALRTKDLARVTIDTTVQPKAITFPTGAKLLHAAIKGLNRLARTQIERNRTAAKQAKKFHGTRCQACDLDFEERYGAIGKGFIGAHHLKPIASLEEGVAVTYDVAADFAVLCANCHRMIHRSDDPSNFNLFKKNLTAIKS